MPEYKVELGPEDNARLEAIRRREDCGAAQAFRLALRRYKASARLEEAPMPLSPANHGELRGGKRR